MTEWYLAQQTRPQERHDLPRSTSHRINRACISSCKELLMSANTFVLLAT
jgi:hypothetical protein